MANIHIENSCKVSKHSFKAVLATYVDMDATEVKAHRSLYSLRAEWAVHNALHSLGLWKERTASVDLNYPCKWAWAYVIIGTIVMPFIK